METITSKNDPLINKKLGNHKITGVLATGGMAKIYIGLDENLDREAAIKVLTRTMLDNDPTLSERFTREARAVAKLEHENIVPIYEYGYAQEEEVYFLAMKIIRGRDLADEINDLQRLGQTMNLERMFLILRQVANALDFAHKNGIIHRDVKPSNVLIDKDDRAYLTDFGLVLRQDVDLTRGTAFGTPRYISPEQALASERAVPQSDTYSLAVIVYEILTGSIMFKGDTAMQVALSHISEPPPLPTALNAAIPKSVERELLKALEKEPEKRHPKASDFIRALELAYGDLLTKANVNPTLPDRPSTFPVKQDAPLDSWDDPTPEETKGKAKAKPKAPKKADATTQPDPKQVSSPVSVPPPTPAPKPSVAPPPNRIESAKPADEAPAPSYPKSMPRKPAKQGQPPIALFGGIGAVVVILLIGIIALSGGGGNSGEGEPVRVYYQQNLLVIRNMGEQTLDLATFSLAQTDGSNVIRGTEFRGGILPPGACLVVKNQTQPTNPLRDWNCTDISREISRQSSALLAWRMDFQIKSDNTVVANCPAQNRNVATSECSFNWSLIRES